MAIGIKNYNKTAQYLIRKNISSYNNGSYPQNILEVTTECDERVQKHIIKLAVEDGWTDIRFQKNEDIIIPL